MTTDFEQGSYTDSKNLPKSSFLYYVDQGFIFKDEHLRDALCSAWIFVTGETELPPAKEARKMVNTFAAFLMETSSRKKFATLGSRHVKHKKAILTTLYNYAVQFITDTWGIQINPFNERH